MKFPRPLVLLVLLFCGLAVSDPSPLRSQAATSQPGTAATPKEQSLAQMEAAGVKMSFDVASVKPNKSGDLRGHSNIAMVGDGWEPMGGLVSLTNIPLELAINFAYGLTADSDRTGMPNWAKHANFDIEARASISNPTKNEVRLMMQTLLAERFKLATHHETRQIAVYALELAKKGKTGPQLRPYSDDGSCDAAAGCGAVFGTPPTMPGRSRRVAKRVTMATIAEQLPENDEVDRPVLDRTGLSGTFDFTLEWSPAPGTFVPSGSQRDAGSPPDTTGPSFVEALQNQLGLKLVPQTAPLDVLVIDHIEEPTPN